jgi:hypothetical protein
MAVRLLPIKKERAKEIVDSYLFLMDLIIERVEYCNNFLEEDNQISTKEIIGINNVSNEFIEIQLNPYIYFSVCNDFNTTGTLDDSRIPPSNFIYLPADCLENYNWEKVLEEYMNEKNNLFEKK